MTKQVTSIRLSDEAEQNINLARSKYTFLTDTTATIELALWVLAHSHVEITGYPHTAPAAHCTKCGETSEKHPTRRCHKFEKPIVTPANWFDGDND